MGTIILGSLCILYGLFTLYARLAGHVSWLKNCLPCRSDMARNGEMSFM